MLNFLFREKFWKKVQKGKFCKSDSGKSLPNPQTFAAAPWQFVKIALRCLFSQINELRVVCFQLKKIVFWHTMFRKSEACGIPFDCFQISRVQSILSIHFPRQLLVIPCNWWTFKWKNTLPKSQYVFITSCIAYVTFLQFYNCSYPDRKNDHISHNFFY